MNRKLTLVLLVAGFAAATSPVWALDAGNPTFTPETASPGQTVSFAGTLPDVGFQPGLCQVADADSDALTYSCSYAGGDFSGLVVLPTTLTPGTTYALSFCGGDGCSNAKLPWTATNTLLVASTPALVTVPDVRCDTTGYAVKVLASYGLVELRTAFPRPIGRVAPPVGSPVSRGSTITPYPALVPTLGRLSYPSASALVNAACATPVPVGPTDGAVAGQAPPPGSAVPTGLEVTVSLTPTPTPAPTPTPTPTPHRGWWWRTTHPDRSVLAWAAGSLVLVGGAAGVHRVRARRGPRFGVRTTFVWAPDRSGQLAPSLVVRRRPSTYRLEEPR
jgi:hypothetical protein